MATVKRIPVMIHLAETAVAEVEAIATQLQTSRAAVCRMLLREGLIAYKKHGWTQ